MRPELEALAGRLGIAAQTHWLGHVAGPERLLSACDVFVLPSVGEAFGHVLAEAMACGAPVVGSRSGAVGEVIADQETGLLVAPRDPAALAGAIERLGRDQSLRRQMGERGRQRVRDKFAVDAAVGKTLAVYESLWNS
jgi:glycosyltransferase involved in cell wall biosynthesis